MADPLYIVTRTGSVSILEILLPYTLDAVEFDRLNATMQEVIGRHPGGRWVLDLSGVAYTGSATLGLIVNIRQYVRQADASLVLCGLSQHLLEIVRACSLERLFIICRTREEAIHRASR